MDEPKKHKYRHAEAATIARFFNRTFGPVHKEGSLSELDDAARATQDDEAAQIMEGMVDRSTHRWLDEKWEDFKYRFPIYLAVFMIAVCVVVVLYTNVKRP